MQSYLALKCEKTGGGKSLFLQNDRKLTASLEIRACREFFWHSFKLDLP